MRVLLINSPWLQTADAYGVKAGARWPSIRSRRQTIQYYPFPFFMAYAAAVLKRLGHEAHLKDAVAEGMSSQAALGYALELRPGLAVVETSTPSIATDLAFARSLRAATGARVVLSGPHAAALPEETLAGGAADLALIGEYEETLPELIEAVQGGRDLAAVAGIAWRDERGAVHVNERRRLIADLDSLPYPERDDLPIERYTDPTCKKYPNLCVIASRGCPHNCTFCVEPSVYYGRPSFRKRRPDSIVDEIQFVQQRYRVEEIYFDDSSFGADPELARGVAQEILGRNLRVYWSCMADAQLDFETLRLMRQAGCHGVKFGVESADPEILRRARKQLDLSQVRAFVDTCRKLGIYTHGTFMFGLPGETRATIERTLAFAFSLRLTTAQFSVATPLPGTDFYREAKEQGWLITDDYARFEGGGSPVVAYPDCSPADLAAAAQRARKLKILHLAASPRVLAQYLLKLQRMHGTAGLARELWAKGSYLLAPRR